MNTAPPGHQLATIKAHGFAAVARALGLTEHRGHTWGPCPACGAERRGSTDPRGPIGARRDDAGFTCHRCNVTGDPVTLVAVHVTGETRPTDWRPVLEAAAGLGLCEARLDTRQFGPFAAPRRRAPRPEPPPIRPPYDEVRALWDTARPISADAECRAYLVHRRPELFTEAAIAVLEADDLVRCLPLTGALPRWARGRAGTWRDTGHRLLFRLWEPDGTLATLQARTIRPDTKPKYLSPAGAEVIQTTAATPAGLRLLRSELPLGNVIVCEGMTDLLALTASALPPMSPEVLARRCAYARTAGAEAVPVMRGGLQGGSGRCYSCGDAAPVGRCAPCAEALALWAEAVPILATLAGAWTPAIAARIPSGSRVIIATDSDAAGDGYATKVHATLKGRCTVERYRP